MKLCFCRRIRETNPGHWVLSIPGPIAEAMGGNVDVKIVCGEGKTLTITPIEF